MRLNRKLTEWLLENSEVLSLGDSAVKYRARASLQSIFSCVPGHSGDSQCLYRDSIKFQLPFRQFNICLATYINISQTCTISLSTWINLDKWMTNQTGEQMERDGGRWIRWREYGRGEKETEADVSGGGGSDIGHRMEKSMWGVNLCWGEMRQEHSERETEVLGWNLIELGDLWPGGLKMHR